MKSILTEAAEVTSGDRNQAYGHALPNHRDIGYGWTGILRAKKILTGDKEIDPATCALMMAWLKIARECHAHKRDNMVDLAGYAKCVQDIHDSLDDDESTEPCRWNDSDPGDEQVDPYEVCPANMDPNRVEGVGCSGMVTTSGLWPGSHYLIDHKTKEGDLAVGIH